MTRSSTSELLLPKKKVTWPCEPWKLNFMPTCTNSRTSALPSGAASLVPQHCCDSSISPAKFLVLLTSLGWFEEVCLQLHWKLDA